MLSKEKYRVVFFLPSLAAGGAQRAALNILRSLNRKQFDPYLLLAQQTGVYLNELPTNLPVLTPFGEERSQKLFYPQRLAESVAAVEADLVISFLNQANVTAALARMIKRRGFKLVISVRNHATGQFAKRPVLERWRKRLMVRLLYRQADHIVAVSEGVREDLIRNFAIPEKKINTIHNGLDLERIRKLAQVELPHWIADRQLKTVVAAGRLVEQKGFVDLLKAFAKVRRQVPARLFILGEGSLREKLEKMVHALGLDNDVFMPGFVDNPWAYMARADVFVLSSHWEGLPAVVIEAMACGTPVIATDCDSGPREYIVDGDSGLLIPVGNANNMAEKILWLFNNESVATRLCEKGLQRAKEFDLDRTCRRFERTFINVIQGNAL